MDKHASDNSHNQTFISSSSNSSNITLNTVKSIKKTNRKRFIINSISRAKLLSDYSCFTKYKNTIVSQISEMNDSKEEDVIENEAAEQIKRINTNRCKNYSEYFNNVLLNVNLRNLESIIESQENENENINPEEEFGNDLKKFPNVFVCHQSQDLGLRQQDQLETFMSSNTDIIEEEDPIRTPRTWNRQLNELMFENDYLNIIESYFEDERNRLSLDHLNLVETNVTRKEEEEELECIICLTLLLEGNSKITLECNHFYHSDCLRIWLGMRNKKCPICKRNIL